MTIWLDAGAKIEVTCPHGTRLTVAEAAAGDVNGETLVDYPALEPEEVPDADVPTRGIHIRYPRGDWPYALVLYGAGLFFAGVAVRGWWP